MASCFIVSCHRSIEFGFGLLLSRKTFFEIILLSTQETLLVGAMGIVVSSDTGTLGGRVAVSGCARLANATFLSVVGTGGPTILAMTAVAGSSTR